MANGQQLDGWGEIAEYLRVGVRTAQNYERDHALPVQRMPGPRGRVFAYVQDLQAWQTAVGNRVKEPAVAESCGELNAAIVSQAEALTTTVPTHSTRRKAYVAALAVSFLCAAAWAVWYHARPLPVPAGIETIANTLIVKDGQGRELWRHVFSRPLRDMYRDPFAEQRMWFASDVDGDGATEIVFTYIPMPSQEDEGVGLGEVLCFSQNGERIKWRFLPGQRKVTDNSGVEYFPPYGITNVKLVPGRSPRDARIVVSSIHHQESPNQVAVLDGRGKLVGEYWHPGHLHSMAFADLGGNGRQKLLLAGVNNAQHSATMIVFDPDHVGGTSTELADASLGLRGFAPGTEVAIVFFPRTCLVLEGPKRDPYNRVVGLTVTKDRLELVVTPGIDRSDPRGLLYDLDYDLRVRSVDALPQFQQSHLEMERAGILKHPLYPDEIKQIAKQVIVRHHPAYRQEVVRQVR